ncbi:MAG: DUF3800 domain-containing protein [Acidobacteria bacterium]|nr:DUF3800 domain-containing protein [Acidobacteriota bacterium]
MLKVYFDGSNNQQFLVLACLAAEEKVWAGFESEWRETLQACGNPPYMHMREAMPLVEAFDGWKPEARNHLIDALVQVIATASQSPKFRVLLCAVDLSGHALWRTRKQLPAPPRLCARVIFAQVWDWYEKFDDPILEPMEIYFDRDEPFMRNIEADWKSSKMRNRFPALNLIRAIEQADMKLFPPLQAADMVAWAVQRLAPKVVPTNTGILVPQRAYDFCNFDDHFSTLATTILRFPREDSIWGHVLDEYQLATWSHAEEGAAAMHPPPSKRKKHPVN